ncbi:Uncharacterised protein [Mycobacteroides abscessus subsp. abscessus]|nr:Uncharacterised protein [Mycobacteroides abscessus subsp. abscessus]
MSTRPPVRSVDSSTTTSAAGATVVAAVKPAIPAPMTTTSVDSCASPVIDGASTRLLWASNAR